MAEPGMTRLVAAGTLLVLSLLAGTVGLVLGSATEGLLGALLVVAGALRFTASRRTWLRRARARG